jgi:hypothetical protein
LPLVNRLFVLAARRLVVSISICCNGIALAMDEKMSMQAPSVSSYQLFILFDGAGQAGWQPGSGPIHHAG